MQALPKDGQNFKSNVEGGHKNGTKLILLCSNLSRRHRYPPWVPVCDAFLIRSVADMIPPAGPLVQANDMGPSHEGL